MTGMCLVAGAALIRRVASQPSMIGRLRSIRIRSRTLLGRSFDRLDAVGCDHELETEAPETPLENVDVVLVVFCVENLHAVPSMTFVARPRSIEPGSTRPISRSSSSRSAAAFLQHTLHIAVEAGCAPPPSSPWWSPPHHRCSRGSRNGRAFLNDRSETGSWSGPLCASRRRGRRNAAA